MPFVSLQKTQRYSSLSHIEVVDVSCRPLVDFYHVLKLECYIDRFQEKWCITLEVNLSLQILMVGLRSYMFTKTVLNGKKSDQ